MRTDEQSLSCFVGLGSVVTINCTIESVPVGTRRIEDLGSLNVGNNVEVDGTSIMINGVTEDNLGVYQCSANNTVAVASINIGM